MESIRNEKFKILAAILVLVVICCMFSACGNRQIFDTTYKFDTAIIELPDGTIVKGKVQSWKDYEDGDQLQVKIDEKTYLVHSSKCVLISE